MERTIIVRLETDEQTPNLRRTLKEHTDCFNVVARIGFESKCSNSVELHKKTYYTLRARYPDLPAQLVCAARVKASETVRSALTWERKHALQFSKLVVKAKRLGKDAPAFKPIKVPQSKSASIRYDQRSYRVNWESRTVSLATVAGRIEVGFTVPKNAIHYIGSKVRSADLCFRNGYFYLHIVISIPAPTVKLSQEVMGIDLGLNHPAVTSNGSFLGERRWKEQERRRFRLRRQLQAKGTRSAKRHLKKLAGKQFRQRRNHDHVLSKRITQNARPGSTIVLENLTNIRENIRHKKGEGQRRIHSWSFAQLLSYIAYKAEARGIKVVTVDPRHTSQTCSRCQHISRSNRRSQNLFLCQKCGYSLNADLNASKNIRDKYIMSRANFGISLVGGPQITRAIVSTHAS